MAKDGEFRVKPQSRIRCDNCGYSMQFEKGARKPNACPNCRVTPTDWRNV